MSALKIIVLFASVLILMSKRGQCQELSQESNKEFANRPKIFSFELLYFAGRSLDDHLVISPYQIWSILTVLAQGAAGKSYDQLKTVLRLPKNETQLLSGYQNLTKHIAGSKKGIEVKNGNFIFFDKNLIINKTFLKSVQDNFDTVLVPLNFENPAIAAKTANDIISQTTQGRIKDALFAPDFEDSQMIMSNAIDFKGLWSMPFDATDTKKEPFFNDNGVQIGEVNMMYQRASLPFANIPQLQGSALELAYGEDKGYSMLIILPHSGVKLLDMFRRFQDVDLYRIFKRIDEDSVLFEGDELDCYIPRFKVTTDAVLNKPLIDMGLVDIFDSSADLRRISNRSLVVSKVVQKTVLEVTENGTIASAVASVLLPDRIGPVKVKANRPFVYLIIEKKTTTILFGGIYSKPSLF